MRDAELLTTALPTLLIGRADRTNETTAADDTQDTRLQAGWRREGVPDYRGRCRLHIVPTNKAIPGEKL